MNINNNITTINGNINNIDNGISNIDNGVTILESIEISDESDEISNINNNIISVLYMLDGLQNSHIKDAIRDLDSKINHLQHDYSEDITNINNNITNINNDISNLDNTMTSILFMLFEWANAFVKNALKELGFQII
jgi:predicted  nucleic acid-binding Zn-ribbon protein